MSEMEHDRLPGQPEYRRLWNSPLTEKYAPYETDHVMGYPWNHVKKEDVPRYHKGADGFWVSDRANASGMALLSCTGDLMCEPRQHMAHRYGDSYFFHPLFQFVRDIFRGSDLVIGNLETNISDYTPYAGEYHRIKTFGKNQYHCNAPECYLDAVRYAGFDALVNANNHDLDSSVSGLVDTLEAIDRHQFMRTGTFLPEEEERALLIDVNGIRLGVLSYATYLNQLEGNFTQLGQDKLLNRYSAEKACRDVAWAREHGAEYVISYIHWGKSYVHEPNEVQQQYAQELADAGVDYIVGSHSHCLQYHNTVTAQDGRVVPVAYSMGNFVTNERKEICKHTGILQLLLKKDENGISMTQYFIPCYVFDEMGTGRFAAVPTDPLLNGGIDNEKLRSAEAYIHNVVADRAPQLPTGRMCLSEVCGMVGISLPEGLEDAPILNCCIDLREVGPRSLFFALQMDEEIIRKAYDQGAAAVVAAGQIGEVPTLTVEDVEEAYCRICHACMGRFTAKAIAVVGRSGKSRTRELAERVLRNHGPVLAAGVDISADATAWQRLRGPQGYYVQGAPRNDPSVDTAAWQRLHPYHAYYLQEIPDNDPDRERLLLKALRPEVCVVTGTVADMAAVAAAVKNGGMVLYNGDDPVLVQTVGALPAGEKARVRFACYGTAENADFRIRNAAAGEETVIFDLDYAGGTAALGCGLPLEELMAPAAAAFALGIGEGMASEKIAGLLQGKVCGGYEQNLLTIDGTLKLLLNCTCKTLRSAESALRALARQAPAEGGRRIAVLGELDAGEEAAEAAYRSMAESAAEAGIHTICLVGEHAEMMAEAAAAKGADRENIVLLPDETALQKYLIGNLQPEDALLINGGRCMQFNTTIRKVFGLTDGVIHEVW